WVLLAGRAIRLRGSSPVDAGRREDGPQRTVAVIEGVPPLTRRCLAVGDGHGTVLGIKPGGDLRRFGWGRWGAGVRPEQLTTSKARVPATTSIRTAVRL